MKNAELNDAGVRVTNIASIGHRPDGYYFMVETEEHGFAWAELDGENPAQNLRTWAAGCAAWAAFRAGANVEVTMYYRAYAEDGEWHRYQGVTRIQLS